MIILGIETSCDETGAAILKQQNGRIQILSNVVASSANLQAKHGGIIPEQAAREQIKSIIPVIDEALRQAFEVVSPQAESAQCTSEDVDAIAITYGPGLIGSLLVGVETAKTLSLVWNKPLIPVNHLIGHFYANWITHLPGVKTHLEGVTMPTFPCIGLLASGGHTDLVLFTDHGKYKYLGGTRDDAAGECFDKCARLLGLPYPGGPEIAKLAKKGDPTKFKLPIPMQESKDLDFSYSGLKTAVTNIIRDCHVVPLNGTPRNDVIASGAKQSQDIYDLAASIEETIVKSLINKVVKAAKIYKVEHIMVAGGVASNKKLTSCLKFKIQNSKFKIKLHVPPPELCTDNGAMIASAAFFLKPIPNPLSLQANPNLSLVLQ